MNGLGILKGLGLTIKHFFATYWTDLVKKDKPEGKRGTLSSEGLFTVQYPEESVHIPEELRIIPFLIYTLGEDGTRNYRCTACGICSKVCPTQCIWITRKKDETTGKPLPASEDFYIDVDKCMNCGTCAEFCPFDAIKLVADGRGIYTAEIMRHNCVGCGGCVGRCPVTAMDMPYFSNQLLEEMVVGSLAGER